MKSLRKNYLYFIVCLMGVAASVNVPSAFAVDPVAVVLKVNKSWRSSDRYIPEDVIRNQALTKISAKTLREYIDAFPDANTLLNTLHVMKHDRKNFINRGVVENLIKIRQIVSRMAQLKATAPLRGQVVYGLRQTKIDQWVEAFDEPNELNRLKSDFNSRTFQQLARKQMDVNVNDFYAIKIAALYYELGYHKNIRTTAELFARGREEIPYLASFGQNTAIHSLPRMKFSEAVIQNLKKHSSLRNISEGFWDYLRHWKFSSDVEMVPPGTVVAANTPIGEIRGSPIDCVLIEAPLLAHMDDSTRHLTMSVRIKQNALDKVLTEGGARRGEGATSRSEAAIIAGFFGTSNIDAATLFGVPAAGSAENHGSIGHFKNELEAHATVLKFFPAEESFLLTDTYHQKSGLMQAVRAGGKDIKGFRVDSRLYQQTQQTVGATIGANSQWLREAGASDPNSMDAAHILFSDDLNEFTLSELRKEGVHFPFGLIGGRLRNGPSMGFVLKVVEVEENGIVVPVLKMSNPEKALVPGRKVLIRNVDQNGKFLGDIAYAAPENIPQIGAKNLRQLVVKQGKVLVPFEELAVTAKRLQNELLHLPVDIFSTEATAATYPFRFSQRLQNFQQEVVAKHLPSNKLQIGVFPLSGDPVHDGHVQLVKQMKARYLLDKVYIVPTGDNPIHGRKYRLPAHARYELTRKKFAGIDGVIVDSVEAFSDEPVATVTTLERILRQEGGESEVDVFLIGGDDFIDYLPTFRRKEDLFNKFNLILAIRQGSSGARNESFAKLPPEISKNFRVLDKNGRLLINKTSKKIAELGDFPYLPAVSGTQVRSHYDRLPYQYVLHFTDPQWTFAKRSWGPSATQLEDGTLAVPGTERTISAIESVLQDAVTNGNVRVSLSKDAHYEIEVSDPTQNAEFHPAGEFRGFPRHGMKGVSGPSGDSYISEIENILATPGHKTVLVPHHRQLEDADGKPLKLELIPYDINSVKEDVLNPSTFFVFEKNGPLSHSVYRNPRFKEYLQMIDPQKLLYHFHLGWCTDYCELEAVMPALESGYKVVVLIDGIAGVNPSGTAAAFKKMRDAGAKFMTVADYLQLSQQWREKKYDWAQITEHMLAWEKGSNTKSKLFNLLDEPFWMQAHHLKGIEQNEPCAVVTILD